MSTNLHATSLPLLGAQRARVVDATELRVEIDGRARPATNALPMYAPRVDDVVLVLDGRDGASHVIGVLDAPAAPRMIASDDGHSLRAASGHLRIEAAGQSLQLSREGLSLAVQGIRAAARTAELAVERAALSAERLDTAVDRVTQRVRVLEVTATRIVERAKDTYREVEQLAQLRAGRLRYTASDALSMVGRRALLKARETMKVRGERIHLA